MKQAIALSGGGTKGSYELGVWKALNELNTDYQIVTGTSIGSINGALMATRDYDRAYDLWSTITMEDMMEDGINLTNTIEGMIDQREAIRPFLKKYVQNKGADISPFTEFIHHLVNEQAIRESDVDFGLVTVQFPSLTPCELSKAEIPEGKMKDYILASSAIFPLFPMHKIGDTMYLDGCYHDNLPISLALRMGAEHVIAVDLHTSPEHEAYASRPYVTYIKPSRSLGTMMNFDHELLMENARMGYQDTMKVYGVYYGWLYTFEKESVEKLAEESRRFVHYIAALDVGLQSELPVKRMAKLTDRNRIHSLLTAKSGGGKMSATEYFVAAAEICGSIFDVDVKPVHDMGEFAKLLRDRVREPYFREAADWLLESESLELAGRLAEMKWNREKEGIAAGIYYAMRQDRIPDKMWLKLLTLFPEELAAAFFLMSLR